MSLSNLGLDALEAIADTGTIVQASKKLGVTQTALTQRIKSLENDLETALFLRSRKGMELTEEGQILYKYCQERRQRESMAIQKIQGSSVVEPRRIRFSGPTLQTQARLLHRLTQLKEQFPELYFSFEINDSEDLSPRLKNNQADFIITSNTPNAALNYKKLGKSEFILVGAYGWKKIPLKDIIQKKSVIDFNEQDNYTTAFLKRFKLLPSSLPERHYINNTHQMLMLVEQGLGYAVFDLEHVKDMIQEKKLINLAPKFRIETQWYLCWSDQGDEMSSLYEKIIRAVT